MTLTLTSLLFQSSTLYPYSKHLKEPSSHPTPLSDILLLLQETNSMERTFTKEHQSINGLISPHVISNLLLPLLPLPEMEEKSMQSKFWLMSTSSQDLLRDNSVEKSFWLEIAPLWLTIAWQPELPWFWLAQERKKERLILMSLLGIFQLLKLMPSLVENNSLKNLTRI